MDYDAHYTRLRPDRASGDDTIETTTRDKNGNTVQDESLSRQNDFEARMVWTKACLQQVHGLDGIES